MRTASKVRIGSSTHSERKRQKTQCSVWKMGRCWCTTASSWPALHKSPLQQPHPQHRIHTRHPKDSYRHWSMHHSTSKSRLSNLSPHCQADMTHLFPGTMCFLEAFQVAGGRDLSIRMSPQHGEVPAALQKRCRLPRMLLGGGLLLFPRMACAIVPARATCTGHERGNFDIQLA